MKTVISMVEDSDRVYCHFPFNQKVMNYFKARLPLESRDKDLGLGWQKDLHCFVFLTEDWYTAERAIADGYDGAENCQFEWKDNMRQFSPTAYEILKEMRKHQ